MMVERIVVYDNPPQFGKEIPEWYNIQIFSVPAGKIETKLDMLENLGFTSIREVKDFERKDSERTPNILAEYLVEGLNFKYNEFWDKKELIEIELENWNFMD